MNDTQLIDRYVLKQISTEDKLIVEARLLIDMEFRHKLKWQLSAYEVSKEYGRKVLKREIVSVEKRLFSEPRFKNFRALVSYIFR